jgi:hypothetical protein
MSTAKRIISNMNIQKMKIAIATASVLGLLLSSATTASAATTPNRTLKASNLVQISYPSMYKLPKSGCAKIPVRYQVNKLGFDETYFTVVISDDQDRHIGEATWYGSSSEASTKAMPKAGTLLIKVCRDSWYDSVEEVDSYPTYRGTYDIYLSAVGDKSADASASMKFSE